LDTGNVDESDSASLKVAVPAGPQSCHGVVPAAEAYRLKEAYPQSIESARKAIQLAPTRRGGFWLAEKPAPKRRL